MPDKKKDKVTTPELLDELIESMTSDDSEDTKIFITPDREAKAKKAWDKWQKDVATSKRKR